MAVPEVDVWGPGSVTVTTSLTVHVNALLVPVKPAESVAVTVTRIPRPWWACRR